MKRLLTKGLVPLFAVLFSVACGASSTSDITISDAWARPSAAMVNATPTVSKSEGMTITMSTSSMGMDGPVSAIYMVISNKGGTADKLISVSADASDVTEVHETKQMENGMMGMQPVQGGLDVPANGSVTLKPGSYHIMLMKLSKDLTPGVNIKLTLKFQSGKEMTVDVPVKAMQ